MLLQPCSRLSRECSRWHCDCCCSVHSNDNTPPTARSEFLHNGIPSVASLACTATGRWLTYMDGHMYMHAFSFVPDQQLCKPSSKALEAQAGNMHVSPSVCQHLEPLWSRISAATIVILHRHHVHDGVKLLSLHQPCCTRYLVRKSSLAEAWQSCVLKGA